MHAWAFSGVRARTWSEGARPGGVREQRDEGAGVAGVVAGIGGDRIPNGLGLAVLVVGERAVQAPVLRDRELHLVKVGGSDLSRHAARSSCDARRVGQVGVPVHKHQRTDGSTTAREGACSTTGVRDLVPLAWCPSPLTQCFFHIPV